jgi:hypothetical protein
MCTRTSVWYGGIMLQYIRSNMYARMKAFVRSSLSTSFHRLLGEVRREFMQRLSVVFHGTLGSYLRDALHEGSTARSHRTGVRTCLGKLALEGRRANLIQLPCDFGLAGDRKGKASETNLLARRSRRRTQ